MSSTPAPEIRPPEAPAPKAPAREAPLPRVIIPDFDDITEVTEVSNPLRKTQSSPAA